MKCDYGGASMFSMATERGAYITDLSHNNHVCQWEWLWTE